MNIIKYSCSNRVAPFWNSLAKIVECAPNLNTFKNLLGNENIICETLYYDFD